MITDSNGQPYVWCSHCGSGVELSDRCAAALDGQHDIVTRNRKVRRALSAEARAGRRPSPISAEAREARRPPPPESLVGALQDRGNVPTSGRLLKSTPIQKPGNPPDA